MALEAGVFARRGDKDYHAHSNFSVDKRRAIWRTYHKRRDRQGGSHHKQAVAATKRYRHSAGYAGKQNKRWQDWELDTMLRARSAGYTCREIALALKRSVVSVMFKLKKMREVA